MARRKPRLTVRYSPRAEKQLAEIYEYNIEQRGLEAASRYVAFLSSNIARLTIEPSIGRPIEARPELRYLLLKYRNRRATDGHIVVYAIVEATNTAEIRFIFHTKQDWEHKL